MKKIYKRISAVVIAVSVFMCASLFAFAAVCPTAPDGVHHFDHKQVGGESREYQGNHRYLYGYDANGNEIFRDNCQLYSVYVSCVNECKYCNVQNGGQHRHMIKFEHSIDHG